MKPARESAKEQQLVLIVDQSFDLGKDLKRIHEKEFFWDPNTGQTEHGFIKHALSKRQRTESAGRLSKKEQRIIDTVHDSRLRISTLIDSPGGTDHQFRGYQRLFEYVQGRGGTIDTYVGKLAASNAAEIAILGNRRFALRTSRIMRHLSSGNHKYPPSIAAYFTPEENTRKETLTRIEWEEMKKFYMQCKDEVRDQIAAMLDSVYQDAENLDARINTTGAQLADWRLIDSAFDDSRGLLQQFMLQTGIDGNLADSKSSIAQFFSKQAA